MIRSCQVIPGSYARVSTAKPVARGPAAAPGLDLFRDVRVRCKLPRKGPEHLEGLRDGLPHLLVVDLGVAVREDVAQAREGRKLLPQLPRNEPLPSGLLEHLAVRVRSADSLLHEQVGERIASGFHKQFEQTRDGVVVLLVRLAPEVAEGRQVLEVAQDLLQLAARDLGGHQPFSNARWIACRERSRSQAVSA